MNFRPSSRLVAALVGAPHYFTGIPCCHGHLAPRRTLNRVCVTCHRREAARKAGLSIHGGEHPRQLAFPGILSTAAGRLPQVTMPATPRSNGTAGPTWRQRAFPFFLPLLQWENP